MVVQIRCDHVWLPGLQGHVCMMIRSQVLHDNLHSLILRRLLTIRPAAIIPYTGLGKSGGRHRISEPCFCTNIINELMAWVLRFVSWFDWVDQIDWVI